MGERVCYSCHLTFILLMCFASISKVSSSPVDASKMSMLQKITVCDTVNFVKNSSYLSKCDKLAYTTVLNKDDKDVLMCMVAYDITNKICAYNSRATAINKLKVPETSQQFDSELRKLEPKTDETLEFIENICKNKTTIFNRINNIDIESSAEVVPFTEYVKEKLLQQGECGYTCHGFNHRVDPFCMFLWWASELFNIKPVKIEPIAEKTLPDKQSAAPVTDTQKEALQQNAKTVKTEVQKKINSEDNGETPVKVDKTPLINQVDKILPASNTKQEEEEAKQQPLDNSNDNKLVEEPKESKLEKPIDEVKEELMPLTDGNEKTSSVASKAVDNAESLNIVQPEKANPEDFNSAEEPPNKKSDDPDLEDANARDNMDDKDTMDDVNFAANNMGNLAEIVDSKKFYAHSSLVTEEDESHFFTYFSVLSLICVGLYVGYHNKQKILAMVLEGRRSRRGRGSRRRPSTASYRKLDSNLEEAVTSQCNSNVTHVIY